MPDCDGNATSAPWGRPCPKSAKWQAHFGVGLSGDPLISRLCDYHKANIDEFPSLYPGVFVERLREAP